MLYIFSFCQVFLLANASVYFANIMYYIMLFKQPKIKLRSKRIVISYASFIIWVAISTVIYNFQIGATSLRIIVQVFFTVQYFILIFDIKIDYLKFEKLVYNFSILLSIYILSMFILLKQFSRLQLLFTVDRMWAENYVPGWPNSIALCLVISLWLSYRNKYSRLGRVLIIICGIVTTSRSAMFSLLIVVIYFNYTKLFKTKKNLVFGAILIVIIILFAEKGLNFILLKVPELQYRMTVYEDRGDIYKVVFNFIKNRPITGYGGNTLDQLYEVFGTMGAIFLWPQTHNWVLEITLRYGIVGTILFSLFLFNLFRNINEKDKKFMFLLLIGMALFQIYIRDFVFLFYLTYITASVENTTKFEIIESDSLAKL